MNYQDGYSQKALDALAKGKYKSLRSSGLANYRYTEGKKKRDNIAVAKQNKKQNPTPRNTNAMANDPRFSLPSVSLPVPTLPMVNAMQGDPRFQVQPEYNGDEVLNQLLGGVKSSVKESPNLSDMIPGNDKKVKSPKKEQKQTDKVAEIMGSFDPTTPVKVTKPEEKAKNRSMVKPATRYKNEPAMQKTELPQRDTTYDKEFAEYWDARFANHDIRDYDPETDRDIPHWQNVKKDIMQKHGWTEEEFEKNFTPYNAEQWTKMSEDEVQGNIGVADKSAALGALLNTMYLPQAMVEGASGIISNLTGYENPDFVGSDPYVATRSREGMKTAATKDMGTVGSTLYNIGLGQLDRAVASQIPILGTAALGAETAARTLLNAEERGVDDTKAGLQALGSGIASGFFNRIGFNKMAEGGSSPIGNILKGAAAEGAEEGAEDLFNIGLDTGLNLDKSELATLHDYYVSQGMSNGQAWLQVAKDKGIDLATSIGTGALFGGLFSTANEIPELKTRLSNVITEKAKDAKYDANQRAKQARVPDVVEQARAQAEKAQAEVERLNEQLPKQPNPEVVQSLQENLDDVNQRIENLENTRTAVVANGGDPSNIDTELNRLNNRKAEIMTGFERQGVEPEEAKAPEAERSFTDMSPEEQAALQSELDSEYNFDQPTSEVAANDTGIESNPTITERYPFPEKADGSRPDYHNIEEVSTRLETTRQSIAKNNEDIEALNKQLNDIPDLKKNAKERSALKNQIYQLEQQNKQSAKLEKILTKISEGKKVSNKDIFEVEFPDDYHAIFDGRGGFFGRVNMATKFAGDTPEAKALAQSIRDDIYSIAKGEFDIENLGGLLEKVYNLDRMAQETKADYRARGTGKNPSRVYKYDDFFAGTKNGIGDDFTSHVIHSLDKAYQIANNMTDIDTTSRVAEAAGESAPVETPESAAAELNQTPVEVTNDTGVDNGVPTVTEGNVPPTNNGGNDDTGVSKLVTHSARNADIVSEYEYENDPVVQDIAKYAKHHNETTFNNALDNVKQNGGKLLEEYNNGARKIDNDQDVDQSMLILQGLTERMRAGEDVSAQRNLLLSKLRQAATTWGQNIQAFAKWNDTADGALINGDRILSGRSEEWESRNQKQVNHNKKVAEDLSKIPTAEYDGTKISNGAGYKVPKVNPNQTNTKLDNALKKQGYDGTMDIPKEPKTHEQIRKEVVNSIKKEYGSVADQFTDNDFEYLTNLVENGATKSEIANALNIKMATGAFGISADTQNKVNLLFEEASKYDPNSVDANRAKAAAYKLIADEVVGKATPYEKFEAWRYIAMLGNPKTMFRNFVGNTTFNVVTSVSNGLSGALEAAVDYPIKAGKWASNKLFKTNFDTSKGIERTKSLAAVIPTKKNASLVKAAWDDAYEHRYNEMSGQKYEKGVQDKIRDSKSVFNSKWAQLYEKLTDAGISDTFAVRTKYSTSLAGYLRANGIDDGIFEADRKFRWLENASRQRVLTDSERADLDSLRSDHEKLEKARDYAVKEAEYATFHEDNEVAKILSDFSRNARNSKNPVAKGIGYIFEGIMPFKKTPANIVRSGYNFSPFGAISSIAKTGKLIYENTGGRRGNLADTYKTKSGKEVNKTLASDVIESWARNLTGAGMMYLGYYLTSKGILNSSNKDELYQDELEGKQNYSITINGHTYTIDWASPASMSLLMGAELHKIVERSAIPGKKVYENVGDVIGTINSLIDPVVETSMMQGVKNTLESAASVARYDDNAGAGLGVLGTMAANAGLNYVSQVVPTILGQGARVIDPVRRSTDTVSPNSFVAGMEKQGRKMMNKIPFLSMLNNPYVNARGEEELNSPSANPLVSIPYQFISPGYLQEINQTEADKSARSVYNAGVPMLDEEGKPLLDENGEQVLVPQMDKGVFETWKSKVTVGDHKFTPDEMYQYRTTAGQANEAIRTALAQEEWFSNLNPQAQNDLLKSVNTLVDKLGKDTVGYPQEDKALDVYKEGGVPDLLNYYKESAIKKQVQGETGLSAQAKKTAEITDAILAGRTDEANQMIAEETQKQEALKPYEDPAEALGIKAQDYSYIKDYAGNSWSKVEPELPKLKGLGVTNYSQYAHAVKYADSNNQSIDAQWFANTTKALDTDKSGGVSQDELIAEFNNKNMSRDEVMRLWGMLALGKDGAETKQEPYIITKGKNKGKWGRK